MIIRRSEHNLAALANEAALELMQIAFQIRATQIIPINVRIAHQLSRHDPQQGIGRERERGGWGRERPETRITLAEPANAALIGSGTAQARNTDGSPAAGHPAWEPHPMQGWSPDFIPAVMQEAVDAALYDQIQPVTGPEAIATAQALAAKEGILTGITGGATVAAALKLAEASDPGSVLLAMLPDTGERYLSTPLFENIEAEMTDEERAISLSTPAAQMV